MRPVLSLILAALLLACPQLCRGESLACCAESRAGEGGESRVPEPSRDEAAGCICAGAVRDSDSQSTSKVLRDDQPPTDHGPFAGLFAVASALAVAIPLRIGAPPGAALDGSIRLHLRFQNLRR